MHFIRTHIHQKCQKGSAAPRPQNSDSDEKDTLFGLDTLHNITITVYFLNRKKISIYEKVRILTFL
jgi:hypothetical protein